MEFPISVYAFHPVELLLPSRLCYKICAIPPDYFDSLLNRHSGQRSRVRKLQYIAELERRVEMLQILESRLGTKVDLLYQQRVILTVENNELKHRIACLAKDKMIKDGQCQSLKSQIERLKLMHTNHSKNRRHSSNMQRSLDSSSELSWQMLDMSKLSLGGGRPISLTDSYRS